MIDNHTYRRATVGRNHARATGKTMSDISINITWWELLLYSPVLGWPGLLVGGAAGWFAWRRRPWLGAVVGAIAGNLAVFSWILFSK